LAYRPEAQPLKGKHPASVAAQFQACAGAVPKKAASGWSMLATTLAQLEARELRRSPGAMIKHVLEAGYEDYLKEQYANYRARQEDLEQLSDFASQFSSNEEFLAQMALLSNLEAEADRPASADSEQIRLSTIHQAKGLEFDVVFVIMLCDGLFPSARSLERPETMAEERRLFYVAITRARNELYLSYPLSRMVRNYGSEASEQASRFLEDIPVDLFEKWNLCSTGFYR